MNTLVCPNCNAPKKDWAKLCWKCHVAEQVADAKTSGYKQGYLDGRGDKEASLDLTTKRWRQLIQFTHPDKHKNSKTSVEITQWLNQVKP